MRDHLSKAGEKKLAIKEDPDRVDFEKIPLSPLPSLPVAPILLCFRQFFVPPPSAVVLISSRAPSSARGSSRSTHNNDQPENSMQADSTNGKPQQPTPHPPPLRTSLTCIPWNSDCFAKESKLKENKVKENKAKENKAKENKVKENKVKENKAKP